MKDIPQQDSEWAIELFDLIEAVEKRVNETLDKAPDQKQREELEHNAKLFRVGIIVMIRLITGK